MTIPSLYGAWGCANLVVAIIEVLVENGAAIRGGVISFSSINDKQSDKYMPFDLKKPQNQVDKSRNDMVTSQISSLMLAFGWGVTFDFEYECAICKPKE